MEYSKSVTIQDVGRLFCGIFNRNWGISTSMALPTLVIQTNKCLLPAALLAGSVEKLRIKLSIIFDISPVNILKNDLSFTCHPFQKGQDEERDREQLAQNNFIHCQDKSQQGNIYDTSSFSCLSISFSLACAAAEEAS